MKGIILAGGEGKRLGSLTDFKPMHEVGGQPMITWPYQTLVDMGCDDITIVTNQKGLKQLDWLEAELVLQEEARGMADALSRVKIEEPTSEPFAVIAADFFFDPPPVFQGEGIYWSPTNTPEQFGVYDPETKQIVEKPTRNIGNMAIVACYVYGLQALEAIKQLQPSERGELEITDLNNLLKPKLFKYEGFWGDMGTPDGINRVEAYLKGQQ